MADDDTSLVAASSKSSAVDAKSGNVMFSTDAPQIIEHTNKGLDFTPYDCKWIPVSPRFIAMGTRARGTGAINVYELTQTGINLVKEIERPNGIKCGTFGASFLEDRHVAVGDYAGDVTMLDLERPTKPIWKVKAHNTLVNCIDGIGGLGIGGGAPELVTGSRDGSVKIWDPRLDTPVASLLPAEGQTTRDAWTVSFGNSYNDDERCVAVGYDNGDVKLFDLRTMSMLWETNVGNGVVSVDFDRKDIEMNKMVVTTLESKFHVYDMRTLHPEKGYARVTEKAHKATVWMAKHLPQNRDLWMTSGGNGGVNLYRYHYPASRHDRDPEGRLVGRPGTVELLNARLLCGQPIVGWDWSPDKEGLACAVSLDQQLRVYLVTRLNKL